MMTDKEKARALARFAIKADKQAAINTANAAEVECFVDSCEIHHMHKLDAEQSKELREWIDMINRDL